MKNKIIVALTFILVLMVGVAEGKLIMTEYTGIQLKSGPRSAQVGDAFSVKALFWSEEVVQAWGG